MKSSTAKMLIVASLINIKYAATSNMKCTCEQAKCTQMGAHEPGRCRNESTGKACMYLGPICDECAMFLDPQYIIDI